MSFYRAELRDFNVGRIYFDRHPGTGKLDKRRLEEEDFNFNLNDSNFNEIYVNLIKSKYGQPRYLIRHLDREDFQLLGFTLADKSKEHLGVFEYVLEREESKIVITHEPALFKVHIMEEYTEQNAGKDVEDFNYTETKFLGYLVDVNELLQVLIMLRVLIERDREDRKFEKVEFIYTT